MKPTRRLMAQNRPCRIAGPGPSHGRSGSARRAARTAAASAAAALALLAGCGKTVWTPTLHQADQPPPQDQEKTFLKVHMHSGELYVLSSWTVDEEGRLIRGAGTRYDVDRRPILGTSEPGGDHAGGDRPGDRGFAIAIPMDSIALLEASQRGAMRPAGLTVMAVMTTVYGATTAYCVADPKACFGSCPTFYAADGEGERLMAEGFSGSIARVLEERDLDALYHARPSGSRFEITMRNEALETHAVRRIRLHAVARPPGGRVFATPAGDYHAAGSPRPPSSCRAAEGDCLEAVLAMDGRGRTSVTDSADLAAREVVELEFPVTEGPLGLVLGARHTFVSTFLLYQTMAYMGTAAGEFFARLERGDPVYLARLRALFEGLGRIEVSVADADGVWRPVGAYGEPGPLATDVQLLPLPATEGHLRVRLELAKGYWRIEYVGLARLEEARASIVLEPVEVVTVAGTPAGPDALAALRDEERYLVTYPGDEHRLVFRLPPSGPDGLELFLESQGYYYEWMREEWLKEENSAMTALILFDSDAYLRRLAPAFKRGESEMERTFWSSRYVR